VTPITRHEYKTTADVRVTDIEHLYLLQYRRLACKTMYVQFCNEAKSCAYRLVNETLWYETETFDFQSKTRSRPRPRHVSTRPRRDQDVWKLRLKTVLRARRRDREYIPDHSAIQL